MLADQLFIQYTATEKTKTGYSCICKKGAWAIFAPTKEEAEREAKKLFYQHYIDGKYAEKT